MPIAMKLAVVRLSGGFGNQLFQYLFGLSFAALHQAQVVFDATDCVSPNSVRPFKLMEFGLEGVFLHADRIYLEDETVKLSNIIFIQGNLDSTEMHLPFIREAGFDYDPPSAPKSNCYLDGYWQSWRYWYDVEKNKALVLRAVRHFFVSKPLIALRERILSTASTAVHLRRGDYLQPFYQEIHGICLADYYRAAVASIEAETGRRPVFVFTDDVIAATELFPDRGDVSVVSTQTRSDLEDFALMTACDGFVISNSSFSYLAASFSQRDNVKVVAPYPWFSNRMETPDLLPRSWLTLNRATGTTQEEDRERVAAATVSVIIPTMNRDHLLPATIETALAQTLKPTEIILSLNGASPALRAVAEDYAQRHPSIHIVDDPKASLPLARNNGLKVANSEWVAFLDDDDLWEADKLERQIEASVRLNADVVACDFDQFNDEGRYDISHLGRLHYLTTWAEALTTSNVIGGGSVVVARRTVVEDCGRFDEALRACEDHDMWRRLALAGFSLAFLPQKLAHYRVASDNMTKNARLMLAGEFAHLGKIVWESQSVENAFVQSAFDRLLTPAIGYFGGERAVAPDSRHASSAPWLERLAEGFDAQLPVLFARFDEAVSSVVAHARQTAEYAEFARGAHAKLQDMLERDVVQEGEVMLLQLKALERETETLNRIDEALPRTTARPANMSAEAAAGGVLAKTYPSAYWRPLALSWIACGGGERLDGTPARLPVPAMQWVYGAISRPLPRADIYDEAVIEVVIGDVQGCANLVVSDPEGSRFYSEERPLLRKGGKIFLDVPAGAASPCLLVRNGGRDGPEGAVEIESVRLLTRSELHALSDPGRRVLSWTAVGLPWRATDEPDAARSLPASFDVPPAAWAYAALSDLIVPPEGEGVLEITVFAQEVRCGLALVSEDGTSLVSVEAVVEPGEFRIVRLACSMGATPLRIVVRNYDDSARRGVIEVFKVRIGVAEAFIDHAIDRAPPPPRLALRRHAGP